MNCVRDENVSPRRGIKRLERIRASASRGNMPDDTKPTTPGRHATRPGEASPRIRARRAAQGSTGLSGWRRARASVEPDSSPSRPRRGRTGRTTSRPLLPPPRFDPPPADGSVTGFLSSSALPKGTAPESTDSAFKGHAALLRRITLHPFEMNRYLFVYKPLAKVHAVLAMQLLNVVDIEAKGAAMSPLLRSAAMYVSANVHRSVYSMVMSCELKSAFKPRPPAENNIPDVVLTGEGLSDQEVAALDFIQELSYDSAHVSEDTRRRVIDGSAEADGQLERRIAGVAAYVSFLSRLSGVIDFQLSYEAVHFATQNLQGLPWKPSGGHFLIESMEKDSDDPFSLDNVSGSALQRLTRGRRSARVHRDRVGGGKDRRGSSGYGGMFRMSNFFTNSITAPRMMTDANRANESWMRAALLPLQGQIFEMNDFMTRCWGFEPFYLSTTAVACEQMRRAFVLGAKELLFQEKEVSRRTKFIVCYVLSHGAENARKIAEAGAKEAANGADALSISKLPLRAPVADKGDYDALAIMTAHAAFLACKYGATPAELRAALDVEAVKATLASQNDGADDRDFVLGGRDCAAVMLAHAMVARPPSVDTGILSSFENAYGSPLKQAVRGGRICHRAFLELVGAAAMWGALQRFASATLAFDLDMTSNMMFGAGRAEPAIMDFALSAVGSDVGLSLHTGEVEHAKARRDSKVGRMSSLMSGLGGGGRAYRKRSSSALTSGPGRVVRMLSNIGPHAANYA